MRTFFDGPYLEQYMKTKMSSVVGNLDLGTYKPMVYLSTEHRPSPYFFSLAQAPSWSPCSRRRRWMRRWTRRSTT